ncbi:MAG: FecR domain-containing protein [gamma proteobacterium symbiont of Bathyaustriella thionipta]|nr:FecR domain-containing protein [gamma proteobacterium symbiont of Bathyaustriella thionipta]
MKKIVYLLFIALLMLAAPLLVAQEGGEAMFHYKVKPGDTIWTFSHFYLKDPESWAAVQKLNQIPVARELQPGTVLQVPMSWLRKRSAQGHLLVVQGQVSLSHAGGKAHQAQLDEAVAAGDQVQTGDESHAVIALRDESEIQMGSNTLLDFRKIQFVVEPPSSGAYIIQSRGTTELRVNPQRPQDLGFVVETPQATTSVRGTHFRVQVEDNDSMRSEVLHGQVLLANEQGKVAVNKDFGSRVRHNQAPSAPRQLLAAPADLPGGEFPAGSVNLHWSAVKGASVYQVQVASDEQFHQQISTQTSPKAALTLDDLAEGSYWLRIHAIDAQGFHGRNAISRIQVQEPLPAVLASAPTAWFTADGLMLHWAAAEPGAVYHLQWSETPDFNSKVIDFYLYQPWMWWPPGLRGQGYVRVSSVAADGSVDAWSEPLELWLP